MLVSPLWIAHGRNLSQMSFSNNGNLSAHKWDVEGHTLASGVTRSEGLNNVSSVRPLLSNS